MRCSAREGKKKVAMPCSFFLFFIAYNRRVSVHLYNPVDPKAAFFGFSKTKKVFKKATETWPCFAPQKKATSGSVEKGGLRCWVALLASRLALQCTPFLTASVAFFLTFLLREAKPKKQGKKEKLGRQGARLHCF